VCALITGAHLSRGERQHPEPADRGMWYVLAIVDIETRAPRAYTVATERMEYHALDPTIASDFWHGPGLVWGLSSRTEDDRLWVVSANSDTRPAVNYIYDHRRKRHAGYCARSWTVWPYGACTRDASPPRWAFAGQLPDQAGYRCPWWRVSRDQHVAPA
jgi:hypothetical protein